MATTPKSKTTKTTTAPARPIGVKPSSASTAASTVTATTTKTSTTRAADAAVTRDAPTTPEATADAVIKPPSLRRKEFVERIVENTGMKPNQVKSVLDGVLSELGAAISAEELIDLNPFGKLTVNRKKSFDGYEVLVCKIRRKTPVADDDAAMKTAAE